MLALPQYCFNPRGTIANGSEVEMPYCYECGTALDQNGLCRHCDSQASWYYISSAIRMGPVSEADFSVLIVQGELRRGSLVLREETPDWVPIENTRFVTKLLPPPVPTRVLAKDVLNAAVTPAKLYWRLWLRINSPHLFRRVAVGFLVLVIVGAVIKAVVERFTR